MMAKNFLHFVVMVAVFVLLTACGGGRSGGGNDAGPAIITEFAPMSDVGTDPGVPIVFNRAGESIIVVFGRYENDELVYTDELMRAELVGGDDTNLLRYPNGVDTTSWVNWFIIPAPADGESATYEILMASGSFQVYVETDIDPVAVYNPAEITIDIVGGGEISGRVTDSVDQSPVYRVLELVNNTTGVIQWIASDSDGNFSFNGVVTGEYTLRTLYSEWDVGHTYMFPGRETSVVVTVP